MSWWHDFIVAPLSRVEAEQREFAASPAARRPDVKVIAVLVTVSIVVILQRYILDPWEIVQDLTGWTVKPADEQAAYWAAWALFQFLTYFVPPWLVIHFTFQEPLTQYGMKLRGLWQSWPVYVAFFAIMLPLLWWVSQHDHFLATYPFYKPAGGEPLWPKFWIWEASYFLQFVGLEFFFRGFMVHGLKHRFGVYSIFVMTVPYVMIHFQKPALETCGALVAGIALGFMSLKTRSIWLGAAIHISVALSMDLLALWRKGQL